MWSPCVGLENPCGNLFWWDSVLSAAVRWDKSSAAAFHCLRERPTNACGAPGQAAMHSCRPGGCLCEGPRVPMCQSLNGLRLLKYQIPKLATAKKCLYLPQKSFHGGFHYRMPSNSKEYRIIKHSITCFTTSEIPSYVHFSFCSLENEASCGSIKISAGLSHSCTPLQVWHERFWHQNRWSVQPA